MPLAAVSFVTPQALVVCASALVPLAVLGWVVRGQRRSARILGLQPSRSRSAIAPALATAGACLALGLAAGQPVLTRTEARSARSQSEVVFVVDVSRSMLASRAPGSATRLERARAIVGDLAGSVPEVRAGLSGLTDRVLPYVFPTLDRTVFDETLARSVQPESPPPQVVSTVATTFAPLAALARDGTFARGTRHRTCVVVTDGETRSDVSDEGSSGQPSLGGEPSLSATPSLGGSSGGAGAATGSTDASALSGGGGCRLIVVRVGSSGDRIYAGDGRPEAAYRPEPGAAQAVERLAASAGGKAFTAGDVAGARSALRADALVGPTQRLGVHTTTRSLAPLLAGLGLLLALAAVLLHRPRAAAA